VTQPTNIQDLADERTATDAPESALRMLLSIASPALSPERAELPPVLRSMAGPLADELEGLLAERNGFFAFESALHVFPAAATSRGYSLARWNEPELWRGEYGSLLLGALCFAEDVFAGQFVLAGGAVHRLEPETGELQVMADTLEEWAATILDDSAFETGHSTATEWQRAHGPLPPGQRLIPKTPFVLGGQYSIENLYAADAVEAMRFRAHLAAQIRDLPDGATVEIRVVD
jgi:hypothetical protein